MSHLTLDQVLMTPLGGLVDQPAESLFHLKHDATELLVSIKAIVEQIDRALDLKYAEPAHKLRLRAGKDTGVVHFDDGPVAVSADLPKKVEWDQNQLAAIVQRIAANGDDPDEYVEVSYRVSESKFNAWPDAIRQVFAPARTVKTGKPTFRLALLQESAQ